MVNLTEDLFSQVNAVLAEWNPIGVPEGTAEDEYQSYVPFLVESWNLSQDVEPAMVWVYTQPLGYDVNPAFSRATRQFATQINQLLQAQDDA
ncbi:hypothetical protein MUN84_22560 (plasmid) [Hymenobacter sp. 5516J-16]|uniref:hypothetical protein n=1 Tax=Hymenobacter sp. 5516J-16 TaxID=2932253 RepID=UPI001FD1F7C4|nr:hypothetical protein [Hymenobacter sp. 5516J-16]UOQ79222.1 hypothetical protein MUN84_22560 [Hymenobacter sp. 5516J-16]